MFVKLNSSVVIISFLEPNFPLPRDKSLKASMNEGSEPTFSFALTLRSNGLWCGHYIGGELQSCTIYCIN